MRQGNLNFFHFTIWLKDISSSSNKAWHIWPHLCLPKKVLVSQRGTMCSTIFLPPQWVSRFPKKECHISLPHHEGQFLHKEAWHTWQYPHVPNAYMTLFVIHCKRQAISNSLHFSLKWKCISASSISPQAIRCVYLSTSHFKMRNTNGLKHSFLIGLFYLQPRRSWPRSQFVLWQQHFQIQLFSYALVNVNPY